MWCRNCQQDVPSYKIEGSFDLYCRRCDSVIRSGSDLAETTWRIDQNQTLNPKEASLPSKVFKLEQTGKAQLSTSEKRPQRSAIESSHHDASVTKSEVEYKSHASARANRSGTNRAQQNLSLNFLRGDQKFASDEREPNELEEISQIVDSWRSGYTYRVDPAHVRATVQPSERKAQTPIELPKKDQSASTGLKRITRATALNRAPVSESFKSKWDWSDGVVRLGKGALFSGLLMGFFTVSGFQAEWTRFAFALTSLGAFSAICGLTWQLSELQERIDSPPRSGDSR